MSTDEKEGGHKRECAQVLDKYPGSDRRPITRDKRGISATNTRPVGSKRGKLPMKHNNMIGQNAIVCHAVVRILR